MSFPTIAPSWLHKFPIKELSYYISMPLGPLQTSQIAVLLQGGGAGRARGTHFHAESDLPSLKTNQKKYWVTLTFHLLSHRFVSLRLSF